MMQFPVYNEHDAPGVDLAQVYARFVVDEMATPVPGQGHNTISQASDYIGKACLSLMSDQHRAPTTQPMLRHVVQLLERPSGRHDGKWSRNPEYTGMIIPTLEAIDDPDALAAARVRTHETLLDRLDGSVHKLAELRQSAQHRSNTLNGRAIGRVIGRLTQNTALGLITRLNHPRLLAMPALAHQDSSTADRTGNFDFALIEGSDTAGTETHKVQVKAKCLGHCGVTERQYDTPQEFVNSARVNRDRMKACEQERLATAERYRTDITVISGCCDVGDIHKYGLNSTIEAAELMIEEYDGELTSVQVRGLDDMSARLLMIITGATDRKGTAKTT